MHALTFQPLPVFYQLPAVHITWQNVILSPINFIWCIFHLGVVPDTEFEDHNFREISPQKLSRMTKKKISAYIDRVILFQTLS